MSIPFSHLKNIAILRRNGLGDVLCTLPLVSLCKQLAPQAKVVLFIDAAAAPLAPYLEGPDETVVIAHTGNKYIDLVKTAWSQPAFDLAISAKTTPMRLMNFSLVAFKARYRLAYVAKSWDSYLVNRPVAYQKTELHQALKLLKLIDPQRESIDPTLYPRLKNIPAAPLKNSLLVSVSNNRAGSSLNLDKLARLLNQLPFHAHISALETDRTRAQHLASLLTAPHTLHIGLDFPSFLALLQSAERILIGDGGTCHLAAALNKPQVVLFGGTKVGEWGPLSDRAICLAHPHNVNEIPDEEILYWVKERC